MHGALKGLLPIAIVLAVAGIARADAPQAVTIHLSSVHPREAMEEFVKQTGFPVEAWPPQLWEQQRGNNQFPTSINLDVDNKSYWEALATLCDAAKLAPANINNGLALQYTGQPIFGKRPQSVQSVATIVADSLERNHTVNIDAENPETSRSCGMHISVYLDPRLRAEKFQPNPAIEQAEDENSHSISKSSDSGSQSMQEVNVPWQLQGLFIPLDYDPQNSHKLATIKGSIDLTVAAEVEKFELPNLAEAQGTSKEVAGIEVAVEELKQDEHSTSIKLNITRKDMPKEQFREIPQKIFRAVKFQTSDGRSSNNGGGGGGNDEKLSYTFSTNYSNENEKPVKLVWEVPTRIDEIQIPFEFHDLPLP